MALNFANRMSRIGKENAVGSEEFLQKTQALRGEFNKSSEAMRIHQAAFNAIVVNRAEGGGDVTRSKVQSLSNLYGYQIDYASKTIEIGDPNAREQVKDELDQMPDGIYFARQILPTDNDKLEVYGHSYVYGKQGEHGFLYDPNQGVRYLFREHHRAVLERMRYTFETFRTHTARFYRLSAWNTV
jgi:hypothetical protein